jgi:hypothetical protein
MPSDLAFAVVIVACGSRSLWWSFAEVKEALIRAAGGRQVLALFHGGARGADRAAGDCAKGLGWPVQERMAQWSQFGIEAGPIRNRQMVAEAGELARSQGAQLAVLAFPGGKGTASCIREARRWQRLQGSGQGGAALLELRLLADVLGVSEMR